MRQLLYLNAVKRRKATAQTMVEYSLGIGCVLAVCLLVLGGLGEAASDVALAVLNNLNASNDQSADASTSSVSGIFSNGVSGQANAPWKPQ
jgi:hypothetical protein